MGQGRAGVTEPPGTVSGSFLPSPLPSLTCRPTVQATESRRELGGREAQAPGAWVRVPRGGTGPSPLPGL